MAAGALSSQFELFSLWFLQMRAGLQRSGKSCHLRWTNYLRPEIKRGKFSVQEEQTIIRLHALLGNRWSAIATHLPNRAGNEIKNHWNTHLKKRLAKMGIDSPATSTLSFSATPPQLMQGAREEARKDKDHLQQQQQWGDHVVDAADADVAAAAFAGMLLDESLIQQQTENEKKYWVGIMDMVNSPSASASSTSVAMPPAPVAHASSSSSTSVAGGSPCPRPRPSDTLRR